MAKQRPTEAAPPAGGPFPDVRFERRDIDAATVFWSGVGFAILAAASTGFAVWLSLQLLREPPPARDLGLPKASYDGPTRPPAPRLEAIEDLDDNRRAVLFPPRAAWQLVPQERQLEQGGEGESPIAQAMASLKLKVRKDATPAPRFFSAILPSKASSGRTETGGDR